MAYRKGTRIVNFTPGFLPFTAVFHIVLTLVRLYDWLVYRIRIRGRENLHGLRGAVLVSNHTLLFDPGIVAHVIRPRRTYFTMLEETAFIPYLGTFVRLLGAIPIPERVGALRSRDAASRSALQLLGYIHFFPEGECYRGSQEIHEFHPGAFLLACRLQVPIVPITTVLHEARWLGKSPFRIAGRLVRFPPRVTVVIGEPVRPPLGSVIGSEPGVSIKSAGPKGPRRDAGGHRYRGRKQDAVSGHDAAPRAPSRGRRKGAAPGNEVAVRARREGASGERHVGGPLSTRSRCPTRVSGKQRSG